MGTNTREVAANLNDNVLATMAPVSEHRIRILVVDDEESLRRVTERTLRSVGYDVVVASDGAEALRLVDAQVLLGEADVRARAVIAAQPATPTPVPRRLRTLARSSTALIGFVT